MSYIMLKDVVKRFDTTLAVDNMSLKIEKGEIFGLLGPNGAGKSTAIKMIMGLLKPNSGEITVAGMNVGKNSLEVKKKLGLVPQELAIFDSLSGRENVSFFGRLYGLRGKKLKERCDEAIEFTGLTEKQKEAPRKYSGGMKRRLNIACAIVHQPDIIIMDEPTVGIDPQSRNHILDSVKELNKRGSTIIYTSHYMEEVELICDRVAILDQGKLIACGDKNSLKKQIDAEEKIIIEATGIRFNPVEDIKKLNGVTGVIVNGDTIEISTKNTQNNLQDILFILARDNVRIHGVKVEELDLENVFLTLTGKRLRD